MGRPRTVRARIVIEVSCPDPNPYSHVPSPAVHSSGHVSNVYLDCGNSRFCEEKPSAFALSWWGQAASFCYLRGSCRCHRSKPRRSCPLISKTTRPMRRYSCQSLGFFSHRTMLSERPKQILRWRRPTPCLSLQGFTFHSKRGFNL